MLSAGRPSNTTNSTSTQASRRITRAAYIAFTRKYGYHIQSDATAYLEKHLENNDNIKEALETFADAYKRQFPDGEPIVTRQNLQQVIHALEFATHSLQDQPTLFRRNALESDIQTGLQSMSIDEKPIDVTQHFHVIDAFAMPRLAYDMHRKTFSRYPAKAGLLSTPKEKSELYRDRFNIVKQRLLRNETFSPSGTTSQPRDSQNHLKITPIKALIGRDREHFLLFGMMTQLEDGKVFLEDEDANVQLNLSRCTYGAGLFTDNTFVLVEGMYGDDHVFHVDEISFPPAEPRSTTDNSFSHINFTGLPKPTVEEHKLKEEEEENDNVFFAILSDVHLDEPSVISGLRRLFEGYSETQIPLAFILMGNFSSRPCGISGARSGPYKDNFSTLAELISDFPKIAAASYFVFVPGSRDPWGGANLPQPAIPESFTARIRQRVRRAIFTSNPCRIRYCTQDIVIFREDILSRLWRNALLPPKLGTEDEPTKHLVRTIIDQGHLCPLPLSTRPVYWAYDHALRLYPLPHALVLADQCEPFGITYEGTHCISPNSFSKSGFSWIVYHPSKKTSEKCSLSS
ncbi:DNA polymerase alpha/epsilon subunit B-domain-containing protein [Dichotomocladium elegans]|nr:DNA polymerase alpha/epsilon subunit B-domain-containing protein [Dichotomocladium elegans]